jgi:hypothetical protein
MSVLNYANLSLSELAEVEAEVGVHRTIEDVLKWGFAGTSAGVRREVIGEVVVQDEFTHDLIVPWRAPLVLVYGAT